MPKHVAGLLYDCTDCCDKLLCNCWNQHNKINLLYGTKIILKTQGRVSGCSPNIVRMKQVMHVECMEDENAPILAREDLAK
jgi:tRNA U54 and U55 pseudouridine synthase Pus10